MAALQPVWSPIRRELQNARDEMCYPQTKESHLDQILCFVVRKIIAIPTVTRDTVRCYSGYEWLAGFSGDM
jgi:hypothetical protein